jgi:uncharacterized protein YqgQ|tara:strand:- start:66 stop:455 length:390 start_codon:yes stop_codon:yes gene_type:complete
MKSVKTISPIILMKKLSKSMKDSIQQDDEDFFYDRLHFMKFNYDNDSEVYKSKEVKDKVQVLNYGLETINILIQQVLRFGRIVYETEDSNVVYNFPKDELPKFYLNDIFSKKKTNSIKTNMKKYEGIKL